MYGSVKKKFSVKADTIAVTMAAERPPSSATTIVKAMKTKARFDAEVRERRGISMKPSARPPSAPITIHTGLSFPGLMTPPRANRDAARRSRRKPDSFEGDGQPRVYSVRRSAGADAVGVVEPLLGERDAEVLQEVVGGIG